MSDIDTVLEERGKRYGEFDKHARITQGIKAFMVSGQSWNRCTPSMKEALEMIAHKIGRIVNGDPMYLDSWVDISGYNELVIKELRAPQSAFIPLSPQTELDKIAAMSRSEYRLWLDEQMSRNR